MVIYGTHKRERKILGRGEIFQPVKRRALVTDTCTRKQLQDIVGRE